MGRVERDGLLGLGLNSADRSSSSPALSTLSSMTLDNFVSMP